MDYKDYRMVLLVFVVLFLAGCGLEKRGQLKTCPGAGSKIELVTLLKLQSEDVTPLKANGNCIWRQKTDGKMVRQESFNIKLWADWPAKVRLQGDLAFDPKGIVLGCNEHEYWLAIRPKEVNSYWWGQWENMDSLGKLKINPKILIEAFGVVDINSEQDWRLSNEGAFDVLAQLDNGMAVKKIYIYNCSRRAEKIEYFDFKGRVIITAEMDKYLKAANNFYVPGIIKVVSRIDEKTEDTFLIKFSSVGRVEFADNQEIMLFTRPDVNGFEHVIENGILDKQK